MPSPSSPIEGRREIERFEIQQDADEAAEVSPDGPWVRFEDHADDMNNARHERNFWSWKYSRREAECEELADRLRAKKEAIEGTAQELERRADREAKQIAGSPRERSYFDGLARAYKLAASLLSAKAGEAQPNPIGDREPDLDYQYEHHIEQCDHGGTLMRLDRAEAALKFYAEQKGLGAVLASDGGMKARAALANVTEEADEHRASGEREQTLIDLAEAFETRPPHEAMRCSEVALYCREQAALAATKKGGE